MLNRFDITSTGAIRPGMEIITRDGRRAGYVAQIVTGQLVTDRPVRRIPLHWIRRVDQADVYIERRLADLDDEN